MNDQELDDRIRAVVAEVADSAPLPPSLPASLRPTDRNEHPVERPTYLEPRAGSSTRSSWLRSVAAIVVLAVLGGAALLMWRQGGEPTDVVTTPTGPTVTVRHEVLEYTNDGPQECGEEGEWNGGPTSFEVETWTDTSTETWRQDLTADDGSTQSQIDIGLNGLWRETYRQGNVRPGGCFDGPSDWPSRYSLNTNQSGRPEAETIGMGVGPAELEVVAESTTDSRGRSARQLRYTETSTGTPGLGSVVTVDYFVDPTGSTILETRVVRTADGSTVFSERMTLDRFEVITVDASIFAGDGYEHIREAGNTPSTGIPASRDQRSCFTAVDLTQICLTREGQTVSIEAGGLRPGSELTVGLETGLEQRSATLTADDAGQVPETELFTITGADDRAWIATATGTHSSGVQAGGLLSLGA